MWNWNMKWNTKLSLQKVLGLLSFGSCPNCMSSANIVAEIQFKLLNERVLSTGAGDIILILFKWYCLMQSLSQYFLLSLFYFNDFLHFNIPWRLMFSYFLIRSFITAKRPKKFCSHWVGEFYPRSCMCYCGKNVKCLLSASFTTYKFTSNSYKKCKLLLFFKKYFPFTDTY